MLIYWLTLLLAGNAMTSSSSGRPEETQTSSPPYREQRFDAQFNSIKQIRLSKPAEVNYRWRSAKDSRDIVVQYTADISINFLIESGVLTLNSAKNESKTITNENEKEEEKVRAEGQDQSQSAAVTQCCGHNTLAAISISLILSMTTNILAGIENPRTNIGVVVAVVLFSTLAIPSNSIEIQYQQSTEPHINIIVPIDYVETICINNNTCFPTTCQLSAISPYSTIPSDNEIVFSGDFCELRKPEQWDEWMLHHFAQNVSSNIAYYLDPDNDGLVNILEYYSGLDIFSSNVDTVTRTSALPLRNKTNPNNPDSDGDLLLDGYEFAYGILNNTKIRQNGDEDMDGLTNLEEQIFKTNPVKADTDMDGVNDGDEVKAFTNPRDPLRENTTTTSHYAKIALTIGDDSEGTERYVMHVGDISHQSSEYGKVTRKTYSFLPGRYKVSIQHIGTTEANGPDFDYFAVIEKEKLSETKLSISDPHDILGKHREGECDVTLGKTATMIIEAVNCNNSDTCACKKTCKECQSLEKCRWDKQAMGCRKSDAMYRFKSREECPCLKCSRWYEKEMEDIEWKNDVHEHLVCPCSVDVWSTHLIETNTNTETTTSPGCAKKTIPIASNIIAITDSNANNHSNMNFATNNKNSTRNITNNNNTTTTNNNKILWQPDPICQNGNSRGCSLFYPGAYRCLYSINTTRTGAAQHCCYDRNGTLLTTEPVITTTKKATYVVGGAVRIGDVGNRYFDHLQQDIFSYKECCLYCEKHDYCNKYHQARAYEAPQQNCTTT